MRGRILLVLPLVCSLAACGTSGDSTGGTAAQVTPSSAATATQGEDPATPELRRGDEGDAVAELQQELTRHGFPVSVDGVFGPATEAAVREFQDANGLSVDGIVGPSTWAALTAPATTSPSTPATTTGAEVTADSAEPLVLRSDGLGVVRFDDPADEALAALTAALGPPDRDGVSTELECALAIEQTRTVSWDSIGLVVLLTDWPGAYDMAPAPLHFATWTLWPTSAATRVLTTSDGIGIGSTAAEVRSLPSSSPLIPNVTQWGFAIDDGSGTVEGDLGWSVNLPFYSLDEQFVIELQRALNEHGAGLAEDGAFDAATSDALIAFAAQHGITGVRIEPNFDSIELTPEVLEVFWLLGLPPDDAPVTAMWAGDPSTCG